MKCVMVSRPGEEEVVCMVNKEAGWRIFWSIPLLPDVAMIPGDEVFLARPQRCQSPAIYVPNEPDPMFSPADEPEDFLTFLAMDERAEDVPL